MVQRVVHFVESRIGVMLSIIILAVVLWPGASWLAADRSPPVVRFDRVEVQNSPVGMGEALLVRVYREKVRDDCPVTESRFAMDQDGRVHNIQTVTWAGGDDATPYVDLAYSLPLSMPDGDYVLFANLKYDCPGDHVFTYEQPPAIFRLRRRS